MSEKTFRKNVTIGDHAFRFEEADGDACLCAFKDGDSYALILFVTARKDGEVVATYEKTWEDASGSTAEQFVAKFCQDAKFRAKCQVSGKPINDVLEKPDSLVNPACARKIAWLNSQPSNKLRFKDFAALKTCGRDKVSGMKWDTLKDQLLAEQVEKLTAEIGQERTLQVLRWIKRGLNLDHAVHKVKVDTEIAQNAR